MTEAFVCDAIRTPIGRFGGSLATVRGDDLALLAPGAPVRETMTATLQALQAAGRPLASALRVLRQLVMERLGVLDVEPDARVGGVPPAMTELAGDVARFHLGVFADPAVPVAAADAAGQHLQHHAIGLACGVGNGFQRQRRAVSAKDGGAHGVQLS